MSDNYADLSAHGPPQPDAQELPGAGLHVYEAVATIEYSGHQATRGAITAATGLADQAVADTLRALTELGALTMAVAGGEPVYVPTRRSWSAQPELAAAHPMT